MNLKNIQSCCTGSLYHDSKKELTELLQALLVGDVPWSADLDAEISTLTRPINVAPIVPYWPCEKEVSLMSL